MQPTEEQRIVSALEYETTENCEQVRRAFNAYFSERNLPICRQRIVVYENSVTVEYYQPKQRQLGAKIYSKNKQHHDCPSGDYY